MDGVMYSSFERLRIWNDARHLLREIYGLTGNGTRFARDFALRDQMRRCALSVMSNIAEGYERGGDRELDQFFRIARSSCAELRSQLYAAQDVGYVEAVLAASLRTSAATLSRRIAAFTQGRAARLK
jgi:four helix bundle protein